MNAPPDYKSDQLLNLTSLFALFMFLICSLKSQVFLRRVVHQLLNPISLFVLFVFLICSVFKTSGDSWFGSDSEQTWKKCSDSKRKQRRVSER
jgi:hypothetical protein